MDAFDNRYFRINKLLLLFSGLWPTQLSFKRNIIVCYTILGTLIVCLPQYAYLIKHVRGLEGIYDILPSISGGTICLAKTIGLHCKIKKFKVLIQHVRTDWYHLAKDEDVQILIQYVNRGRTFTLVYLVFLFTGGICYITAPFTMPLINKILSLNMTTPKLPFPCEFYLDPEKYYYIFVGILYIGCVSCLMVVLATDSIYVALLQHICGMLAIVREEMKLLIYEVVYLHSHRLEKIATHNKSELVGHDRVFDSDKDVERLIGCVQLQIRIERLIRLIESTFAICLIIDIGIGILLQCSSCVMIVTRVDTTEIMRNIPLLLLQSTRIFFNSLVGQMVTDHSTQISVAAYNGLWYKSSLKARKMLLLLIAKCQKPSYITIAKLYVISLEGYSMVMRTSASYVTLMISLQSDDI